MKAAGHLALFSWLSPSFPTGAFAYSHGLERVIADGDVRDGTTLLAWVLELMRHGSIRTDLILAACSANSLGAGDHGRFRQVSELALALSPSRERHLETTQQGRSFMDTLRAAWPSPMLDDIILDPSAEIAYPVAFGAALFAHGLKLSPSLAAYALQSGSNLVSAAVRLGTVGQTEAQKIIASLAKPARGAAALAARANLEDLGAATFRSDMASLRHETQYTRLFRS
jgi:urease accessory protein